MADAAFEPVVRVTLLPHALSETVLPPLEQCGGAPRRERRVVHPVRVPFNGFSIEPRPRPLTRPRVRTPAGGVFSLTSPAGATAGPDGDAATPRRGARLKVKCGAQRGAARRCWYVPRGACARPGPTRPSPAAVCHSKQYVPRTRNQSVWVSDPGRPGPTPADDGTAEAAGRAGVTATWVAPLQAATDTARSTHLAHPWTPSRV